MRNTDNCTRFSILTEANVQHRKIENRFLHSHGLHKRFSCRGLWLCAEFFQRRGHRVRVVVPTICEDHMFVKDGRIEVMDRDVLDRLNALDMLVRAPERSILDETGRTTRIRPYDDKYVP